MNLLGSVGRDLFLVDGFRFHFGIAAWVEPNLRALFRESGAGVVDPGFLIDLRLRGLVEDFFRLHFLVRILIKLLDVVVDLLLRLAVK